MILFAVSGTQGVSRAGPFLGIFAPNQNVVFLPFQTNLADAPAIFHGDDLAFANGDVLKLHQDSMPMRSPVTMTVTDFFSYNTLSGPESVKGDE
jgi:hypothetical protein